jgi:hypothetical protein
MPAILERCSRVILQLPTYSFDYHRFRASQDQGRRLQTNNAVVMDHQNHQTVKAIGHMPGATKAERKHEAKRNLTNPKKHETVLSRGRFVLSRRYLSVHKPI